jgi:flagellar biosynthesis/type III secretory pathway protein FliH
MPKNKKFAGALFAEDFDTPPPAAPAAPASAPAMFTAEDLAAARAAAWREGQEAGLALARDGAATATGAALATIAAELPAARAALAAGAEQTAENLARLLAAALAAALPALCARHGEAEIRAVAAEILPSLTHEPNIRVLVAPEHMAALQAEIATLDHELAEHVRLIATPALGPSDITIRWHHGEAVRDAAELWDQIAATLTLHGLLSAAPTPEPVARTPGKKHQKEHAHVE